MREAQPTQVPTIDPPVNEDKASEGSEDIPIKSTEGEQNEPGSVQIKAPSSSPSPPEPRKGLPFSVTMTDADTDNNRLVLHNRLRKDSDDNQAWEQLATLEAACGADPQAIQALARAWWGLDTADRTQRARQWLTHAPNDSLTRRWCSAVSGTYSPDDHDALNARARTLDVRSLWLRAVALHQTGYSDRLALLETKDELLERVRYGLVRHLDMPSFLGESSTLTNERSGRVAALKQLADYLAQSRRPPHPAEEAPDNTVALTHYLLSLGFSFLGDLEAEKRFRNKATRLNSAPLVDAIRSAYHRQQQGWGHPHARPHEDEQIGDLSGIERYIFDQLLEESSLLRPLERHSAISQWHARNSDAPQSESPHDTLNAISQQSPRLGLPLLAEFIQTLPPSWGLMIRFRAYALALAWTRPKLASSALSHLTTALAQTTDQQALSSLARALPQLARFGASTASMDLLDTLRPRLAEPADLLALESACAAAGYPNTAIASAHALLDELHHDLPIRKRVERIRAIAEAVACAPGEDAFALLGPLCEQWIYMQDNRVSNKYFSMSALLFVESLITAYVGPNQRSDQPLLDQDEAAFRRRLELDTRSLSYE